MDPRELILTGGRVVTPDGVRVDAWIRVAGSTIAEVGTGPAPTNAASLDLAGKWLVPGFVDTHCHGGGGGSFAAADPASIRTTISTHQRHGTTTMLASLVSAPLDELDGQLGALRELVTDGELAGVHLEGPFLSEARCGAHNTTTLTDPDPELVDRLLVAGGGAIRMVTLAPERRGAIEAVRRLDGQGVLAALGHTDATADQVLPAVDAGASVATHLFNGMRPLHHREPGPVAALLTDERVTIELICDLVHVHPTVLRLAASHAGVERTVLVTDAISATEAGDGTYALGDLSVTVTGGEPRLADGALAGSTLTMDAAFRNMVLSGGFSMADAVAATAAKPAELLGLEHVGAIRPGARADLVVLNGDLRPNGVMRRGDWLTSAA